MEMFSTVFFAVLGFEVALFVGLLLALILFVLFIIFGAWLQNHNKLD